MSTNYCITIFTAGGENIREDGEHETTFKAELGDLPIKGYMFQLERCPETSRLHYQGFFILQKRVRVGTVKTAIPRHHFEVMKGKVIQNKIYCGKDDTKVAGPWKWGDLPENAGKREDLEGLKEAIRSGASKRALLEDHSVAFAKYPRFVEQYRELHSGRGVVRIEEWVLRPWQQFFWDLISGEPDERKIHWVYDCVGNQGKSWLAGLLRQEKSVFYCNGGKHADLLYAYRGEPIVIFDYVRESMEYVAYGVMEQLKNGMYFSPKYQSEMRCYKKPHLLVFANFQMADGKLSKDREDNYFFIGNEMWRRNGDLSNKIC